MKKELENLGFAVDPLLRISEARDLLQRHEVITPLPTIQTLHNYVQDGTLRGFQNDKGFYFVYKSSLIEWIKSLQNRNGDK